MRSLLVFLINRLAIQSEDILDYLFSRFRLGTFLLQRCAKLVWESNSLAPITAHISMENESSSGSPT